MQGRAVVWVPGTDHAGIATQNVVERQLAAEGLHRDDLGRDEVRRAGVELRERDRAARSSSSSRRSAASCDWERTRFTLDPELSRAVREVFVQPLREGAHLPRRVHHQLVSPLPDRALQRGGRGDGDRRARSGTCATRWPRRHPGGEAAAAEKQRAEAAGRRGPAFGLGRLPDGRWYVTVSTTRPETMLGRHGGGRPPGRRALPGPRGRRRRASAHGSHDPDRGRRARRSRSSAPAW